MDTTNVYIELITWSQVPFPTKHYLLRALSGATTLGHSGPGSGGNEGVLLIPQSSSITGTSPLDCLVSYLGHSLGKVLPLCRDAVGVFYSPSRLGKENAEGLKHFYDGHT